MKERYSNAGTDEGANDDSAYVRGARCRGGGSTKQGLLVRRRLQQPTPGSDPSSHNFSLPLRYR